MAGTNKGFRIFANIIMILLMLCCLLPFILLTGDEPAGLLAREPRLDACLAKDFTLEEHLPALIGEVMTRHARG